MAGETRTTHTKSTQNSKHSEHSDANSFKESEGESPETFGPGLDMLERSLQGLAGDGVQFSMDPETRQQNLLALQQTFGNQVSQVLLFDHGFRSRPTQTTNSPLRH